jgi:hypothetical protein
MNSQEAYFMQEEAMVMQREVRMRLPRLLAELLDDPGVRVQSAQGGSDFPFDLVVSDSRGRRWLVEIKSSSRPGHVASAAEQLPGFARARVVPVLVVPFMSRTGADIADRARLNWIDLSGNAHVRAEDLHILVQGRPNQWRSRGRPSSAFAPKSARVARALLQAPQRWWLQKDLVASTGLDDGSISRIVRRLDEEFLLERRERKLRPRDPGLLLDAWAQDYRFGGHDIVPCHLTGSGIDLARTVASRLGSMSVHHAFTGLPAAWVMDNFAAFRLVTVYVEGDPRVAVEGLGARRAAAGSNLQLVGPNDMDILRYEHEQGGLNCVSTVQVYLDLLQLPERAADAARHLRSEHMRWHDAAR